MSPSLFHTCKVSRVSSVWVAYLFIYIFDGRIPPYRNLATVCTTYVLYSTVSVISCRRIWAPYLQNLNVPYPLITPATDLICDRNVRRPMPSSSRVLQHQNITTRARESNELIGRSEIFSVINVRSVSRILYSSILSYVLFIALL